MTMTSSKRDITMPTPADWVPGPPQGEWTYEAYAALPDDGCRYEVVQGVLMMAPAPELPHQGAIARINRYLDEQIFSTERGIVLTSPVDVVLSPRKVVQPDIVVLLAEHLDRIGIGDKNIQGPVDLAVEVMSPSSVTYDRLVKHDLYEEEGIPEYWLVNQKQQCIEVFILEGGKYRSLGRFREEQPLQSRLLPEATVPVSWFFQWTGKMRK